MTQSLPIESVLPSISEVLRTSQCAVLSAAPGAGKTTRVPLALLDEPWMAGRKLLMLEPRRLAARRSAEFMASLLNEKVGETVGYRIRGEQHTSAKTKVEILTEGIFTRMLHDAPDLPGIAIVVFDEFHERSIHADLGLAFALDVQKHLRDDLRLLVMSATLDQLSVASLMGNAPVIESEGRMFPVETVYEQFLQEGLIERKVCETVKRALSDCTGDILAFLPGRREIRRTMEMLRDAALASTVELHALYGDAPSRDQQAALLPDSAGRRKVILSTSVAETSLTIDGVCVVIDSGLSRVSRFDPRRGMEGLATIPVSQASADQRRGRAGRQQPGVCYRLWTEEQQEALPRYATPEIASADLAPLALDLAQWGTVAGEGLKFLDPPPPAHLAQARNLLAQLGVLDASGALTPHGKAVAALPVHPRLGHMMLKGKDLGAGGLACDIAALFEEQDLFRGLRGVDLDLESRLAALQSVKNVDGAVRERVLAEAGRLRRIMTIDGLATDNVAPGILVALAYPERVARRRDGTGNRYQTVGGIGAVVPEWSKLGREEYLALAEVDGSGVEVKVFLGATIHEEDLIEIFGDRIIEEDDVRWDDRDEAVVSRRVRRLGRVILSDVRIDPSSNKARAAMIEGIHALGLASLPWLRDVEVFRARSEWLRRTGLITSAWPDLSDEQLLTTMETWLGPFLHGITRRVQLAQLDLLAIVRSMFTYQQLKELDRLAPATLKVPTGSQIRINYAGPQPLLPVKLQEMFGQTETPTVGGGTKPVLLHLLSPAGRPLAVTQDLPSFWRSVYPEVRKEMRGRYPKHVWPDDPLSAQPTRRTKKRLK